MGRLRRFLSPQLADAGHRPPATSRSWRATGARSRSCSATCAASPAFAETVEPEDVMDVLREYHAALGDLDPPLRGHARALHGRRADGLLQRSAAVPGRAAAGGADGRRDARRASRELAERVEPPRPRPRLRRRHRPGPRDARADRLRGALGLRRDRQRDQPRRAAVRRGRRRADPHQPARARGGRGHRRRPSPSASSRCAASRGRRARTTWSDSTRRGRAHDGRSPRQRRGSAISPSSERGARFERLQERLVPSGARCGSTSRASRSSWCRPSRPTRRQGGAVVQALEERFLFLLLLLRQPRLQVIYLTGRPVPESIVEYYLGAAARRDPAPGARRGCTWSRPTTARRARSPTKLLERPRVLGRDARADPRPDALPPRAVLDDARSSATSR